METGARRRCCQETAGKFTALEDEKESHFFHYHRSNFVIISLYKGGNHLSELPICIEVNLWRHVLGVSVSLKLAQFSLSNIFQSKFFLENLRIFISLS